MMALHESYDDRLREVELTTQSNTDRLEAHEDVCAERYRNIHSSMDGMRTILIRAAALLITGMAGILVKLLFFPAP